MNKKLRYLLTGVSICLASFTGVAQQSAPGIAWQKSLGGSGDDQANSIVKTPGGGFIIVGTSKSNDGDVTGHHGSTDSTDAWVVKLSSTGTIQWQKSIGGSGVDELDQVIATNDGAYVAIGHTSSNDGDVSGNHGDWDIWVVKIDRNGNILWQKCLGGSLRDKAASIRRTNDGGYILIGNTNSDDGDVTGNPPGQYPVNSLWVAKLDVLGNLSWESCYGTASGAIGYDVLPLADGTYLLGADAAGGGGAAGNFSGGGQGPVAWLAKISATGQLLETEAAGSTSSVYGFFPLNGHQFYLLEHLNYCQPANPDNGLSLSLADTAFAQNGFLSATYNNVYGVCGRTIDPSQLGYSTSIGGNSMAVTSSGAGILAGASSDTAAITFSPNLSHLSLGTHGGGSDGFLATFSPVTWAKCYGGSGYDVFQGLVAIDDFNFIAAGYSNSNDGDVSGNHGGNDFWIVKFNNFNTIKGTVYLDYNANGVRDGGEPLVNDILVQSQKGATLASSSTFNGVFSNSVDTGAYTTRVLTALPYYSPLPLVKSSNFSSYNSLDSFSFALQPVPSQRDYRINLFTLNRARPGFTCTYWLECTNAGTDTLINRTVSLIRDPRITLISATPAQSSVAGDTIRWTIARLNPRDTVLILATMQIPAPPGTQAGDTLVNSAVVDSTGDLTPHDNLSILSQVVTDAYDPNEKFESLGGTIDSADAARGKYLQYTIRFQNTGTDTAFNIVLRDTLSNKVDPSTVEMMGASAPYQLTIKNGNILTWTLSNIQLPSSIQNDPGSVGFVAYRVKPVSGLAGGDRISNSAWIYFDFNSGQPTGPEITLVNSNRISFLPPPPEPVIMGLSSQYCQLSGAQKIRIVNIPPVSDSVTAEASLDGNALSIAADSSLSLAPGAIAVGAHNLTIIYTNRTGADTLVTGFQVIAPVRPLVMLSSNSASRLAQVVITATDIANGGNNPTYSWSKDIAFGTVLQTQGPLNTLTVDTVSLQVGNNIFHVRMYSTDTCLIAPYGEDSIVLVRRPDGVQGGGAAKVGVVDPDYPGQVISAGPNPFPSQIKVDGLQPAKNYTISLINSDGQETVRVMAAGQTSAILPVTSNSGGIYLLRVYDETGHRVIGYIKMLALRP